ncbi:MAG: RNA-binding protein [Acidimicrobiia bacterium]|nr:RNA-binding protein [Acidimicrobiia bacterium]MBT8191888.1 RNA-binding protein [Acidimicrobiia bacterium]MBT8247079.1 RNA-binding protein [Acidimicrobiia bacterium]NNF89179.1 RNA-binding protein [Acidimicrobiia bacterium]NNL96575.1 RNA-binding protein [Acidimicrobiia bacterium]
MPTKLYVGNIPWSQTDQDLERLFDGHGTVVSAEVVLDSHSGRSRGFGFVVMGSEDDCKRAIQALDNQEIGGRAIVVNHAHRKKNEVVRPTRKRKKAEAAS